MKNRYAYGNVALLYGARDPESLLYPRELDRWREHPELQVRITVDRADANWAGDVGVVTNGFAKVDFEPANTIVMVCGPEIMIRLTVLALRDLGVPLAQIYASLERNMKCAIGLCGHCQFGPEFVCKDGPVFPVSRVMDNLMQREI
jgi:NAD(P)H-flavin reductase